jgi:phage gp46-like protein
MIDIGIEWSNELWRGDWWVDPAGSLGTRADIETAILISLFSDRTALPDDELPDEGTVRGWWADTYRRFPIGSRLWLLWRSKQTEIVRLKVEEYGREALHWLVEIGAVRSVTVGAEWVERGFLVMTIGVEKPGGDREVWQYRLAWGAIA